MFYKLFLLFTVVPAMELALLVYAGSEIGVLNTISIIILTGVAGSLLVRHEGLGVMQRLQSNLSMGVFPSEEILDGAMILVSGALLLTPGFVTDLIGLALVMPQSRALIKPPLKRFLKRKFTIVDPGFQGRGGRDEDGPWS